MSDTEETSPPVPPPPPKIPPPPSEHPPPYTPFCTQQTTSLLPGPSTPRNQNVPNRNSEPVRPIQPQGLRKYLQYLTRKNLLIAGICLLFLTIFIIWASSGTNEEPTKEDQVSHKPEIKYLEVVKRNLGAFKHENQRISFDENENVVILSRYKPANREVQSKKFFLEDDTSAPSEKSQPIDNKKGDFEDCMKFTSELICCSTSSHSKHHKTECFMNRKNEIIHSTASMYSFSRNWQSLENDDVLLIVYNRQRSAVLDLKTSNIYKIEENRMPSGYVSAGFFFPMDTRQELDELVRYSNEFRICEYNKLKDGDYILKDHECIKTPFQVEFELPKVKFCSNPIYTAVIQYGHHNEQDTLTWKLKIKYDSEDIVYSAKNSLRTANEEIALDCNEETLEVYVMGDNELVEYSVDLPNPASEHFLQRTMRSTY